MDVVIETGGASAPAPTTHADLAAGFAAELAAERGEEPAKATAEEIATADDAADEEAAAPVEAEQSETGEVEEAATAEADEGAETPTDDQPIVAPSGMSEADKAEFAKLPTDMKAWLTKQAAAATADYTRKSQAVAEQKKQFDATVPVLIQRLQAVEDILKTATDNQIAPPNPELRVTDPETYDRDLADYMYAQHQREVATKERQKVEAEKKALQEAHYQQFHQTRQEELREKAPELFGPKGREIGQQIQDYAQKLGYSVEQLRHSSANDLITLWKAQRFDAIEAAKKTVKSVPPPAPKVSKPGPAKAVGRPTNLARAVTNLSQNPSRDALVAAFAAEIASEKH